MAKGEVIIYGIIGKDTKYVDVVHQVKMMDEDVDEIDVHINSEGGYVEEGQRIHKYLKKLPQKINTIGSGVVASIATVIFMAGENRTISDNTIFFIHMPRQSSENLKTSKELLRDGEDLKRLEGKFKRFYSRHTSLTENEAKELLESETELTNEQLYSFGFITEKVRQAKAVAFYNPKKHNEMTEDKSKLKAIFNIIAGKDEEPKAQLELNADDQSKIVFPDIDEASEIEAGVNATVDGEAADGQWTVDVEGEKFVLKFENGSLTEIQAAEDEDEDEEEEANNGLEERIKKLEEKVEEKDAQINKLQGKIQESDKILNKIKGVRSTFNDGVDPKQPKRKGKGKSDLQKGLQAFANA